MDDLSKEYIISFFDKNLGLHGDRPEAVRWSSTGQQFHYHFMLDIGDINGTKILDFGCGKGDFYDYLKDAGIEVEYSGIDINEKLISLARKKHQGVDFRVLDIEKDALDEEFDYAFMCGVFNLKVQGIDELIKNSLIKLFSHCRAGLAFNALSAHNPKKDVELNYVSPEEMFTFAVQNLSPYISLRHDRMNYDFVMFVYKGINSKKCSYIVA